MTTIKLPVQVALGTHREPLRIRGATDASGGWSILECRDAEHARQIMAQYPSAAMPCWRNPRAAWNQP